MTFFQILQDFIEYLKDWEITTRNDKTSFITPQTFTGFQVSLTTALQLHTYLTEQCGYEYFMTSKMNQDSLEVLFYIVAAVSLGATISSAGTVDARGRALAKCQCALAPRGGDAAERAAFSWLKCIQQGDIRAIETELTSLPALAE